jgi:hypothetical protein
VSYALHDRAAAIELALELLATGRVRGVPGDHAPAELDAVLGPPTSEWEPPDTDLTLVRHFGLLVAYCHRPTPRAPWRNDLFVAELRWLTKPVRWPVLGRELRGLGYDIGYEPRPDLGADYYTVTESGSSASVFKDSAALRGRRNRLWSRVYHVSAADGPPHRAGTDDFNAVHRTVYKAIGGPASSWPDWLDQQGGPDPARLRTAAGAVEVVLREHPSRAAEAVAFHAWLMAQAAGAGAWPADEWAYRLAGFAAAHRDLAGVPAPDTVAAHCLAALPMDRDAAGRLPSGWREIAPADVRASKMTRALLRCARAAGPQDAATVAELDRWQPLLPKLC